MDIAIPFNPFEVGMEVLEHELGSWYALRDGEDIYLDVRTGLKGYAFWLLLKLDSTEAADYQEGKKFFLRALVKQILQSPLPYFRRNASVETQMVVYEALAAWRHGPRRPKV